MLEHMLTSLSQLPIAVLVLGGVWLLSMIGLPIIRWVWSDSAVPFGVSIGVLLQTVTVLTLTALGAGLRATLIAGVLVALLGWLLEFVGSHTGFPFGRYHYTKRLQPQVGEVPVLIPLAWIMMMPPSWAVATVLVPSGNILWFSLVAGAAFAAWDLFLDPQMVGWNFWEWEQDGWYFGIPLQNLLGWFFGATVITFVVRLVLGGFGLSVVPLVIMYLLTWFLESVGQLAFWDMKGSGIVGLLGMGIFLVLTFMMF